MRDIKQMFDFLKSKQHVCNAPFVSLNFKSTGSISACCMSRQFELGRYPESSLTDIWFGERIKEMREAIDSFNFTKGCQSCFKQLVNGNYYNSLLASFDSKLIPTNNILPAILEFEMSSICNYECIMCGGDWSSSIRKNREKLPPLHSPYDSAFVKQLELFAPRLVCARFLGGEPFATPLYYNIWDMLYKYNPNIELSITTNGSVLNSKVFDIFDRYPNVALCISLDSLNHETYKFIRRNGDLSNVLKNIDRITEYEVQNNRKIFRSIAVCPMIQNWHEIPTLMEYCDSRNINICFNNVTGVLGGRIKGIHENGDVKPGINVNNDELLPEVSINTLPREEIIKIINVYKEIKVRNVWNSGKLDGLIGSLQCMITQ